MSIVYLVAINMLLLRNTLLLVPVIYAIFVLDLKLVKWEKTEEPTPDASHVPA